MAKRGARKKPFPNPNALKPLTIRVTPRTLELINQLDNPEDLRNLLGIYAENRVAINSGSKSADEFKMNFGVEAAKVTGIP